MGTAGIGVVNGSPQVLSLRPDWKRLVAGQTRSFDTGGSGQWRIHRMSRRPTLYFTITRMKCLAMPVTQALRNVKRYKDAAKWHIAMKRGMLKQIAEAPFKDLFAELDRTRAQIRARFEYPLTSSGIVPAWQGAI